jgi:hypothetical protein
VSGPELFPKGIFVSYWLFYSPRVCDQQVQTSWIIEDTSKGREEKVISQAPDEVVIFSFLEFIYSIEFLLLRRFEMETGFRINLSMSLVAVVHKITMTIC